MKYVLLLTSCCLALAAQTTAGENTINTNRKPGIRQSKDCNVQHLVGVVSCLKSKATGTRKRNAQFAQGTPGAAGSQMDAAGWLRPPVTGELDQDSEERDYLPECS